MRTTLILGGARSGKSRYAEELASNVCGAVLFVATAEPGDEEMQKRIEAHRRNRPMFWQTLEATENVGSQITENIGAAQTVIIDCITLLVSNVLLKHENEPDEVVEKAVTDETDGLIECTGSSEANFIIVSNEVGLGLVPADPLSRRYRDLLGRVNQALAQHADEVVMLVAGLPVTVKKG